MSEQPQSEGGAVSPPAEFTPNEYPEGRLAPRGRGPEQLKGETAGAPRLTPRHYGRAEAAPPAGGREIGGGGGAGGRNPPP